MGETLRKYLCFCARPHNEIKVFNILLLGLTNSGKTEIGHVIIGEKRKDYGITNGVRQFSKTYENFKINVTEIGGSIDMQKIWHYYFVKAMAIIYTIDVSDISKLPRAFQTLDTIAEHRFIQGKPILVMATKSDQSEEIEIQDLEEYYNLEHMANRYKCPLSLRDCQLDDYNQLYQGLDWLCNKLENDYETLRHRISYETRIAKFEKIPVKHIKISKATQTIRNHDPPRPLTAPARTNKIYLSDKRNRKNVRLRRIFVSNNIKNDFIVVNDENDNLDNLKEVNPSMETFVNKLNLEKEDSIEDESSKNETIQIQNYNSNGNGNGDGDGDGDTNRIPLSNMSLSSGLNGFKKFRNNRVDGIDVNEIISMPES